MEEESLNVPAAMASVALPTDVTVLHAWSLT